MITMIKPYGEIRTGTNYLRALILRNYPDIHVLSYILGGKHAPPVPFDALWKQAQQAGEIAEFTGIGSPYEEPASPGILADTDLHAAERIVDLLLERLAGEGVIRGF